MKEKKFYRNMVGALAAIAASTSFSATPIYLHHQSIDFLQTLDAKTFISFKPSTRINDLNGITHTRLKQLYNGVPVFGGEVIIHESQSNPPTLTGLMYKNLREDLGQIPAIEKDKFLKNAIQAYRQKTGNQREATDKKVDFIVYIDKNKKAHWVYYVSFLLDTKEGAPLKPSFLIDAITQKVYVEWDDIQTEQVYGGGLGGNIKMGQLTYDGARKNLPKLDMTRIPQDEQCALQNADVTVIDRHLGDIVLTFPCKTPDPAHKNLWWNGDFDAVNDGYSPGNDALYAGRVIQDMYMKWYGIPTLVDDEGKAKMLNMRVHQLYYDNAYWDGYQMTFGDGFSTFYPLVSLGVGAHEISHGFTQQHSNLQYWSESGGLNESFSDMAAQAAEYYSQGKNSWQIGPEILKKPGALRYMDKPSRDCHLGRSPGQWCSIDKISQYSEGLDVHFSSGIFNRVFYLMGGTKGYRNTKKAFDVMVQANRFYWTSTSSFKEAACGVLSAAQDLKYDVKVVKRALDTVEIDYSEC